MRNTMNSYLTLINNLSRLIVATVFIAVATAASCAANHFKLRGEYYYVIPPDESLNIAKKKATDFAISEAIKQEFGENVTFDIETTIENGKANTTGKCISSTGAYHIVHLENPHFEPTVDIDKQQFIVKASVYISVIPRDLKRPNIDVKTYRNSIADVNLTTKFTSGDKILLAFTASSDGFVSIFYKDFLGKDVMTLLPYQGDSHKNVPVKKGKTLIFFSKEYDNCAKEYTLRAEKISENCELYVIFSTEDFSHSPSEHSDNSSGISVQSADDFDSWHRNLLLSPIVSINTVNITLNK